MTEVPDASQRYEPIALSDESTVVAEFVDDPAKESSYQSEAALEQAFIRLLQSEAYEYLTITDQGALDRQLARPDGASQPDRILRHRVAAVLSGRSPEE